MFAGSNPTNITTKLKCSVSDTVWWRQEK